MHEIKALETHEHVGFDMGWSQNYRRIFDYHLQISVHEVKNKGNVWPMTEDIYNNNKAVSYSKNWTNQGKGTLRGGFPKRR